MASIQNRGLRRLVKASVYSWRGLGAAYRHEEAFRIEVWLCAVLIPLGLYLGEDGVARALLVASVLLVPLVEILNSAIEAVVDRVGADQHELSGRAKDMGSAAVGIALVLTGSVWCLVLLVD